MEVGLHSAVEELIEFFIVHSGIFGQIMEIEVVLSDLLADLRQVFLRAEEIGNLPDRQYIVQIFHKGFLNDFVVGEKEHALLVTHTALHRPSLNILTELSQLVSLVQFDHEEVILGDKGCQFCETVSARAAITHQQTMAFRQFYDSVDLADIIDGILEEDDIHLVFLGLVVILLQLINTDVLEFIPVSIGDFLIDIRRIFIEEVYKDGILFQFVGALLHVAVEVELDLFCDDFLHFLTIFNVH